MSKLMSFHKVVMEGKKDIFKSAQSDLQKESN